MQDSRYGRGRRHVTIPSQLDPDLTTERLRSWIRDFGAEKHPAFIRDLTAVLDDNDRLRIELAAAKTVEHK